MTLRKPAQTSHNDFLIKMGHDGDADDDAENCGGLDDDVDDDGGVDDDDDDAENCGGPDDDVGDDDDDGGDGDALELFLLHLFRSQIQRF